MPYYPPAPSAAPGSLVTGTTTVDFGAFPGSDEVTVDVTGQTGFVATSECWVFIQPIATADHSVDEHLIEHIEVRAYYLVDGTIRIVASVVPFQQIARISENYKLNRAQTHRLHGIFTVGWAWA